MATPIGLYTKPADARAFDSHSFDKHVPLAKTNPGLRRYEVSQGPVAEGPSPCRLAALLAFDAMAAMGAAFCDTRSV